jgi:hypothetical protein
MTDPNDIIPETELGRDTGGTSQRRGVHGDPWRTVGTLEVGRPSTSPGRLVVEFEPFPLLEEEVSWPMTLGLWGLALLVGVIYGFYFL